MGIRLFVEVLDYAPDTLTWRERHALSVLAENANDDTRTCWPGIEDDPVIAHRMRLTGRSSRYEVMKGLRSKKAIETVSVGRRGSRAVYRILEMAPAQRPGTTDPNDEKGSGNPGHSVPETRTQSNEQGPGTTDPKSEKGSGNDPNRVREPHEQGPGTTDPFPSDSSVPSSKPASKQAGSPRQSPKTIPDFARPLIDQISAADVHVRWGLHEHEWFQVHALIKKCGIPSMAAVAIKAARRTEVESARYFLPGWSELPPLPAPGTERTKLHAVKPGGHQPFQLTTDPSAYANGF